VRELRRSGYLEEMSGFFGLVRGKPVPAAVRSVESSKTCHNLQAFPIHAANQPALGPSILDRFSFDQPGIAKERHDVGAMVRTVIVLFGPLKLQ
jgi:hypothetical protein